VAGVKHRLKNTFKKSVKKKIPTLRKKEKKKKSDLNNGASSQKLISFRMV
jgi:hypothetical protein